MARRKDENNEMATCKKRLAATKKQAFLIRKTKKDVQTKVIFFIAARIFCIRNSYVCSICNL